MRRLPNGHLRPTSREKLLIVQIRRVVKPGEWFTFRKVKDRLKKSFGLRATLREIETCVEGLRMGDRGYIMEERDTGEVYRKTKNPIFRYCITGRRDEQAARNKRNK